MLKHISVGECYTPQASLGKLGYLHSDSYSLP